MFSVLLQLGEEEFEDWHRNEEEKKKRRCAYCGSYTHNEYECKMEEQDIMRGVLREDIWAPGPYFNDEWCYKEDTPSTDEERGIKHKKKNKKMLKVKWSDEETTCMARDTNNNLNDIIKINIEVYEDFSEVVQCSEIEEGEIEYDGEFVCTEPNVIFNDFFR